MNKPVRIGVLDSGVCCTHPHVGKIAGGITVTANGFAPGFDDVLGHGTAVASVIHWMNPEADLLAVKIFDRKLATSLPVVLRAIDWCLQQDVQVINLSLGTVNPEYRIGFEEAVAKCVAAGTVIVSALKMNGVDALPGSLDDVVGVVESEEYGMWERSGKTICSAPPYPRDIPGVLREKNLKGVSFSVGRVSARIAQTVAEFGWAGSETKCNKMDFSFIAFEKPWRLESGKRIWLSTFQWPTRGKSPLSGLDQ